MGVRRTGTDGGSEDAASIPDVTFDLDQARRDIAAGRVLPGIDARRMLREVQASTALSPASADRGPSVEAGDGPNHDSVFDLERSRRDLEAGRVVNDYDPARSLREYRAAKAVAQNPSVRKLRCPPSVSAAIASGAAVEFLAIVSVTEADHVPEGARIRSRIGPTILTASIDARALPGVLEDARVASVQVSSAAPSDGS